MAPTTVKYRKLTFPPPTETEVQALVDAFAQGDYSVPDRPRNGRYLVFDDGELVPVDEQTLVTSWLIGGTRLAELRRISGVVLRDLYDIRVAEPLDETEVEPLNFFVVDLPPEDYWPVVTGSSEVFPDAEIELLATPSKVVARFFVETPLEVVVESIRTVALTVASPQRANLGDIEEVYRTSTAVGWWIHVSTGRRGATASDLIKLGQACSAAVGALRGAELDRETVGALVRAGMTDVIVGLKESAWFEAKGQMWELDSPEGRIELAQDAARFANGAGGLILVGAATRKRGGVDTVTKVRGMPVKQGTLTRIAAVLDARIYPAIEGLSVWSADTAEGRSVVVIEVPPQPDWLRPYLVHGTTVGGKVEGAFFSIVRRRGEDSITLTAPEVHAWLAAGRRLMQGDS